MEGGFRRERQPNGLIQHEISHYAQQITQKDLPPFFVTSLSSAYEIQISRDDSEMAMSSLKLPYKEQKQ